MRNVELWRLPGIGRGHFNAARQLMPRIQHSLPQAVFYLFRLNPETGLEDGPWGTGFIVMRSSRHPTGKPHVYGITNWHVAHQLGASIIRVNTKAGKSRFIQLDPSEWAKAKDEDDLSAVDLSDQIDLERDEVIGLYEDLFVTPLVVERFDIGLGEDTFMCGLFASHHGGERNIPMTRFGNIAMMASQAAPVELETGFKRPCYLVDTRSRGGFSGSPVFVYRPGLADISWLPYGKFRTADLLTTNATDYFWGLLGIHCGQFWDKVEARKVKKSNSKSEHEPITEGDSLLIQSGVTTVIPAHRISSLLDSDGFEMARRKRELQDEDAADRRPRPEIIDDDSSRSDANPNHLEDFTRLVDVAARKRPQGDQT
jgi:hypothetical protein